MKGRSVIVGVLVVACAGPATAPTTLPPALSTTTTLPPAATYEVATCTDAPPRTWSVLCQAFDLVETHHLTVPEPAALAAAATSGVRAVPSGSAAIPPPEGVFRCTLPDPAFEPVCAEIFDRHRFDSLPVEVLVGAAVSGMFRYGLDPFSAYIPPDFADRLDALGSGSVFTLGLIVGARDGEGSACGPIADDCILRVLAVFDFGPAEREGIVNGDVIAAVDGTPVAGLSEAEAVAAMTAPPGSTTVLAVERSTGQVEKHLVHEAIRFDPVEFAMVTPAIAYLRLNDFSQAAAQLTGLVLQQPEVQAAGAMILDVRDNPGGLLLSAQAIASQFLDGGLVLREEGRGEVLELPVIEGGLGSPNLRLVVLTNRGSASAAEIVAAVLQERGRATVVGEPTFGKNLVQHVFTARDGGEIRITVARWTTPDGLDIGVRGLEPDILVEDRTTADSDPVLERALALLGA